MVSIYSANEDSEVAQIKNGMSLAVHPVSFFNLLET